MDTISIQKVIVCGFPHCGTTILRSILGHLPNVYEVVDETHVITEEHVAAAQCQGKDTVLIKYPHCVDLFHQKYSDYYKIFILRNPAFVFSSINARFMNPAYPLELKPSPLQYDSAAKAFTTYKNCGGDDDKMICLKYEDLFDSDGGHRAIDLVIEKFWKKTTPVEIYKNELYNNKSHSYFDKSDINEPPKPTNHDFYRTWQINQPFECMNDAGKINLTEEQIELLDTLPNIQNVYQKPVSSIRSITQDLNETQ